MGKITQEMVFQAKQSISQQSPRELQTPSDINEISIYQDEIAPAEIIAYETTKIQVAFPKINTAFTAILSERLVANGFTTQRLIDAVSYLIDNFKYQTPSIADIINFDRKVKLYSYNEVVEFVTSDKGTFDDFYKHWIGETLYWVKKSDAENNNLVKYLNKK